MKAKKNSYKRVYRSDGTFHFPKIEENLLRIKGKEYFTSLELTGSSEGTEKDPKISLLNLYQETIIPILEEKVVKSINENGKVKVVIVKQEDNAGLHTDATYKNTMKKEFKKRDWIILDQAPQSPTTNIHDACMFPMMSKQVTRDQSFLFRIRVLVGEELSRTVMKVWNDQTNLAAISRAFVHHTQVANTILEYEGGNEYLV